MKLSFFFYKIKSVASTTIITRVIRNMALNGPRKTADVPTLLTVGALLTNPLKLAEFERYL